MELFIPEPQDDASVGIKKIYELHDTTIFWDERLAKPEAAVAFHGGSDRMIIGYSAGTSPWLDAPTKAPNKST